MRPNAQPRHCDFNKLSHMSLARGDSSTAPTARQHSHSPQRGSPQRSRLWWRPHQNMPLMPWGSAS